jgi:hypothetical protein
MPLDGFECCSVCVGEQYLLRHDFVPKGSDCVMLVLSSDSSVLFLVIWQSEDLSYPER